MRVGGAAVVGCRGKRFRSVQAAPAVVPTVGPGVVGLEMDSGSILAPLMEKLMETGHVEEFVEQVGVGVQAGMGV